MKTILAFIFLFFSFWTIQAQNLDIDTVSTYDVNLSDYMTTNGRVFYANGKTISKDKYEFYRESWKKLQECQPCKVYTYNIDGILKHISIQYNECLVNNFVEYYPNGKIKVEGNFKAVENNDWSNLRLRGLCSIREGNWNYYNDNGVLSYIETYENGKVINTEYIKEEKPSTINKFKDVFKRKTEE
ncbi:MAG: hypothetical protein LC105_12420 [Chitinophagales bacterium]|nr:hypothetical protein [Chitinophagales bacterium]MCZ2394657.1 hypothetical protein [Chitinophagales bacterium]